MSQLSAEFTADKFLRTPISTINRVLKELDNAEQAHANIYSLSTARLIEALLQVAHGFSGSKKKMQKINTKDFLPFPLWEPDTEVQNKVDGETRKLLVDLVKRRRIPMYVFTNLITPSPE